MYQQIYSFENLYLAAKAAARNKRFCNPIMKYMSNLEANLFELQNTLSQKRYTPAPYRQFYVYEPKERLISAPAFQDRVVHHAICNIIEPAIDKRFIDDSYACRKGRGAHKGIDRAQKFMRITKRNHGKVFALKADIAKYFDSIDHDVLKHILAQHIRCKDTLNLLYQIIDSSPSKAKGVGIPIGNLTSQLFANIYLNELDRFIKHQLGERFYIRYMDDFCIIHHDKQHLHNIRRIIEQWLDKNLKIHTNHKTQVFPIHQTHGRSLDFLGYRLYPTHRLLRKCTVKRMKHKFKKLHKKYRKEEIALDEIKPIIASYLGHASHANSERLIHSLLSTPFIKQGN